MGKPERLKMTAITRVNAFEILTRTDLKALNQKRKGLDTMARTLYKIFDYVIRRFNAPSAGLKSGLNLR
jgi:hypothetical protein